LPLFADLGDGEGLQIQILSSVLFRLRAQELENGLGDALAHAGTAPITAAGAIAEKAY